MPTETIREQILSLMQTTFEAMSFPNYWTRPQLVKREWLNPITVRNYPHISIVEGDEENGVGGTGGSLAPFGFTDASFSVELQGAMTDTDNRSRAGGRFLRDLEVALMTLDGQTFGGAHVDIAVLGKALDLTNVEAPLVVCGLASLIKWKYRSGNPSQS